MKRLMDKAEKDVFFEIMAEMLVGQKAEVIKEFLRLNINKRQLKKNRLI